jgi:FtsH-binding integral membrane protein
MKRKFDMRNAQPIPQYMKQYMRRIFLFMLAYMIILIGGLTYAKTAAPSEPVRIALSVMTALPICGMFWTIFRLLIDVDDEYQRLLFAKQILLGTAWALVIATVWEFLKVYDVLESGPRWTGVIWFMTFGLAGGYVRWRA